MNLETTGAQPEITLLGLAVVLGIVQMLLGSVAARTQQGYNWGLGPRDLPAPVTGIPARLQRAFYNYIETFPLFAAALLAAIMIDRTGDLTRIGASVYLAGRVLYVPLYAFGTFLWRTVAWVIATFGLFAVVAALFI